jgi:hypothetical protein
MAPLPRGEYDTEKLLALLEQILTEAGGRCVAVDAQNDSRFFFPHGNGFFYDP